MCYCKFVFYFYYKQPFSITMETKRLHFDSPLYRECCTHTHAHTDSGIVLLSAPPVSTYHCHFCRTSDVNARYTCNYTAQMQHTTYSYRLTTKNLTSGVHTLNATPGVSAQLKTRFPSEIHGKTDVIDTSPTQPLQATTYPNIRCLC